MASDIEIAQAAIPQPIGDIAAKLSIPEEALEPYGRIKAKSVSIGCSSNRFAILLG